MHDANDQWIEITKGVSANRRQIAAGTNCEVAVGPRDMLWVTALNGSANCIMPVDRTPKTLGAFDSAIFMWPRGPWKLVIYGDQELQLGVFKISLEALHTMLSVEYHSDDQSRGRFDLKQLSRIVHFSPTRIRDLGRIFLQSHDSRFKSIARQGVFLDLFSEMLEQLYGVDMAQCPFQIDADTERKIRKAQSLLIQNLKATPDIADLAIEVDLPKQVLKEGFLFIYGKGFQTYLNDYRFEQARVMLESGQYLIKQVSFEIGYQNPSHFISAFKSRYGTTPKQWVKLQG